MHPDRPRISCRGAYEKFPDGTEKDISGEIPFEIPESWEWVRLGSVIDLISGRDLEPSDYNDLNCGFPYITGASNIDSRTHTISIKRWTTKPQVMAKEGDLLLTCKGAGVGKYAFMSLTEAHIARQIMALRPLWRVRIQYLGCFIEFALSDFRSKMNGVIPGISRQDVLDIVFPLPPLAEQRRIVAKMEELEPLIKEYEAAETAARAHEAAFPDALRKSILQAAVQGALMPQDPGDEPAAALLDRIGVKTRIVRTSDNRAYETLPDGKRKEITAEIPFEIPETWEWVRLGELVEIISGLSYKKEDIVGTGIRVLRGGNIKEDARIHLWDDDVFVPISYRSPAMEIRQGDILIVASTGSSAVIGRAAFAERDMECVQIGAFLRIVRCRLSAVSPWVKILFRGDYYRKHIQESSKGTNIKNIKAEYITDFLVPLPPLAEQKRIVAKVEELQDVAKALGND